jgi:hypothetical protein
MQNMVVRECRGSSGGLALFWRRVGVVIRSLSTYHINAIVLEEGMEWRLTGCMVVNRRWRRRGGLDKNFCATNIQIVVVPW